MATRKPKLPKPRSLPVDGTIRGRLLHGWHFLFQRFVLLDGSLLLVARSTPPVWPFHRDINLDASLFEDLVAGDATREQRYVPLEIEITAAFTNAGIEPPAWMGPVAVAHATAGPGH